MSSKWKLITAVMMLCLIGGGVAVYKVSSLGVPFWPGEQVYDWQVEARVTFFATGRRVKARLALPRANVTDRRGRESGSLGYHYNIETERGGQTAVWAAENRDGKQSLYYWVRFPGAGTSAADRVAAESAEPSSVGLGGAVGDAFVVIVDELRRVTTDPDALFVAVFQRINQESGSQEFTLVKRYYEEEFGDDAMLRMGIDMLESSGVRARKAYGVSLDEELGAQDPIPLIEYCDGAYWRVRDPRDPGAILDGAKLFVWHRGGGPLLDVTGGENSRVVFTVARERIPLHELTDLQGSPFLISTILGLPLSERAVFRYLVLIPLGAFVVVLMRNIIGVATLGTFMPVLLALALLEMPVAQGLVMFSILTAVGLWFRFMLSRLNLLVVPRVAACVVIVTLLMMMMTVVSYHLGLQDGVRITLFPMIILAWTIERMSIIWEEEGNWSALTQVGGSLVVAVLAYWFMGIPVVRYWSFYFPELLLVLLAGILMIGRYTGYRLSELIRFRNFTES